MLSQEDLRQIAAKGITEAQVETQLGEFKQGFPFLRLEAAAAVAMAAAVERGLFQSVCAPAVCDACAILKELEEE